MKLFQAVIVSVVLASATVPAHAAEVTVAKAAELGCHRIERLVTLRKIDAAFLDKFYAFRIEKLTQSSPSDPAFRFRSYQAMASDGTSRMVEILMDAKGKGTSHQVIEGSDGNAPTWPKTDPVTLMEYALHYVLENGTTKAEIAPFYNQLTEATLTQVPGASGQMVAQAIFKSSETSKILTVIQGLDGALISAEVK